MNRIKRTWPLISLLCAVAIVTAAALAVRNRLVEPEWIAQACVSHAPGAPVAAWQCSIRAWSVAGFVHNGYGVAALIAGVMATILRWRILAVTAVVVGVIGAILYRFDLAGLGGLLGALVWMRSFGNSGSIKSGAVEPPRANE